MELIWGLVVVSAIMGLLLGSMAAGFCFVLFAVGVFYLWVWRAGIWKDDIIQQGRREAGFREVWELHSDKPSEGTVVHPFLLGFSPFWILGLPIGIMVVGVFMLGPERSEAFLKAGPGARIGLYVLLLGLVWAAVWKLRILVQRRRYAGEKLVFGTYGELMAEAGKVQAPEEALRWAWTLRNEAMCKASGPRGLFRWWWGVENGGRASEFFDSECLMQTLDYMERRFPGGAADPALRQRYWNFGRPIYELLRFRGCTVKENSPFADTLPEDSAASRRQRAERLAAERVRLSSQSGLRRVIGEEMTIDQALEVIGLAEMPSSSALSKLREGMLEAASGAERVDLIRAFTVVQDAL